MGKILPEVLLPDVQRLGSPLGREESSRVLFMGGSEKVRVRRGYGQNFVM